MVYTIVMTRHGDSEFNAKNLFCGWYDAPLTKQGEEEARECGEALVNANVKVDVVHTSVLIRAIKTSEIILKECNQTNIPIRKTWRLNERHYGALTGLDKVTMAQIYGEKQVNIWRRSYDVPPPPMDCTNKYYNEIVNDPRYEGVFPKDQFPSRESLKDTIERVAVYWENVIKNDLIAGKTVLIVAHGNSLRGLIKYIENISDEGITNVNVPTGIPFIYKLDNNLKPTTPMQFLGDPEKVQKAIEKVAVIYKCKHFTF